MSTLANARDVLRLMTRLRRDLTVTDVATELAVPKSSASRTLSMMADHGFLERDAQSLAYRPGPLVMEASFHFRASRNALSLLEEELSAMVGDTGYAGYINLLDEAETVVISMRTGKVGTLQAYTPVGTRGPAHATSTGRALLARLDDQEVTARIGTDLAHIGTAPDSPDELLQALQRVRIDGWSVSRGEFVTQVAGVAAAVLDPTSGQLFGIGLALPSDELTDEAVPAYGERMRASAMRVGKSIGDPYWLDFDQAGPA
ncbi:IclR family transcriptional regulator [Nocardioides albus]|uniref:DNA-binding IclR family transcriptional regulator n=1 Tax=Nocardioides albus TaxID=1841 RepID=A0A7W5A203_9ACTN|nr:IclR family transcriptional regulator [Nocardioides albus]MBB3087884.1 DNA-binding IclR family transcriptional regulator [Nocardioides albus]GGU21021.1 transcriptional regulator [Nocardioides albus]